MKRLLYIIIFICSTLNITAIGTIKLEVGETKTLDVAAMNVNYRWSVSCSCVDVIGGGGNSSYIRIRGHKAGVGSITCSWTNADFSNQDSWTIVVEEKSVKSVIKDDYDNKYNHSISMSFTTGTLQPLSLNVSHEGAVLQKGTEVKLTASDSRAAIRYTLDGSEPNENSNTYTTAIVMNDDAKLRARAYLDGFECPEISRNYIITDLEYIAYYPASDNDMFTYKDMNPYVELSDYVEQGEKWNELSFTSQGINVDGMFFLSSKRIVFVPNKPLDMGKTYEMVIPEGAVRKKNAPNMATTWKIKTGDYVKSISAGEKLSAAILSGDIMVYWGTCWYNNMWTTCSPAKDLWPVVNVPYVTSGYSQLVYPSSENGPWNIVQAMPIKNEEQINWVERQYDTTNTIWVAGGQTTAVIKDGILKMAGRNDFGQVGKKEEMVYKELQTIDLSNVKQVVPTMYTTFALTEDGSLYGWGYNGYGLFLDGTHKNSDTPKLIMKDVASVAASKFG